MQTEAPIQFREITLDTRGVKTDSREIPVAFSSETPIQRHDWRDGTPYMEILDHSPGNVDLSRLNNSGAFLVNHDTSDQVGAIKPGTAKVGFDRVGRAVIKMSRSARATEILNDITDGIRTLISFGYQVTKELSREVVNGIEHRRFAFAAHEVSSVPIPADVSVGVGRSHSQSPNSKKIMSLEVNEQPNREREIAAISKHIGDKVPGIQELATRAIVSGQSLEDFRQTVFALMPQTQPVCPPIPLDVKPREWARYSLAKAITQRLDGRLDGFEREMNEELALRHARKAEGFWVPDEIMARNAVQSVGTLGGHLVQMDNAGDQLISLLRNKSQVIALGARVLNLSRQCTIPKQSAAMAANWCTETTSSTLSGIELQQITLSPKAITAQCQYSKLLLMESDPSIDFVLRNDINEQLGLAIDLAALAGTGSAQPTGIYNTTGVGSVVLSGNGLSIENTTAFPALLSLESTLAAANADDGPSLAYLMRPTVRGSLKKTVKFTSTASPIWEDDKINGYRAATTNQISNQLSCGTATTITTPVYFGAWSDLLIANFNSTDLVVDEFSKAANRVVVLHAHRFVDLAVRRAASFALLHGILNG